MFKYLKAVRWFEKNYHSNFSSESFKINYEYHPRARSVFAINDFLASESFATKILSYDISLAKKIKEQFIIDYDNKILLVDNVSDHSMTGIDIEGNDVSILLNFSDPRKYYYCVLENMFPSQSQFSKRIINWGIKILFLFSAVFLIGSLFVNNYFLFLIFFLNSLGLGIGFFILIKENDQSSNLGSSFCKKNGKDQCKELFQSKFSTLFGVLKLSQLAVFYFVFEICNTVLTAIEPTNFNVLMLTSFLSLSIIPYSIITQIKENKYCKLCLLLVSVVVVKAIVFAFYTQGFQWVVEFNNVLLIFLISGIITYLTVRLTKYQSIFNHSIRLNKMIFRNPLKLKSMLFSEKPIEKVSLDSDVVLGNPEAKNELIIVINFNCTSCKFAIEWSKKLIQINNDVKCVFRFNLLGQAKSHMHIPVHLVSLNLMDKSVARKAFLYWFDARSESSDQVIEKIQDRFPIQNPNELPAQRSLDQLNHWLKETNINFAPTIFLNGYRLPPSLNLRDIQVFLQYV